MDNEHQEIVDVVDCNGVVVGTAHKPDVYTDGLSNRIVHIFVIDPASGSIFLQKRGAKVVYLPNHYCTSAGGHVSSGEEYDVAARRELEEEIGLRTELHHVEKFIYTCNQSGAPTARFISLYVTYANKGFELSEEEVSEGYFVSLPEFEEILNKGKNLHPQLEPCWEVFRESEWF